MEEVVRARKTVSFYNLAVIFNLLIMWFLLERALKRKAKGDKDEARKSRKLADKATVVVPCSLCTKAGIYDPLNPHSRSSARNCPLRSPNIDDYLKAVLHGNFSRSVVKIGFGNLLRLEGNDAIRFSKEVELAVDLVRYVAITSMLLASFFVTRWFSDHDAAPPRLFTSAFFYACQQLVLGKNPTGRDLPLQEMRQAFNALAISSPNIRVPMRLMAHGHYSPMLAYLSQQSSVIFTNHTVEAFESNAINFFKASLTARAPVIYFYPIM